MSPVTEAPFLDVKTGSNRVTTVTLNRPEARNAFNGAAIAEITTIFSYLASATGIDVVRVRGAGPVFCAGMDLKYSAGLKEASAEKVREASMNLARMFRAVVECGKAKPMVVEVQGGAYGGAMGFIGAATLVIAEEHTKMGLTEVRLGLGPFTVGPSVIHKIGPRLTEKLALSGDLIDEQTADDLGLVNEIAHYSKDQAALRRAGDIVIDTEILPHIKRWMEIGWGSPAVDIPSAEEQQRTIERYIDECPEAAPGAIAATEAAIWHIYGLMQKSGEPYTQAVMAYAADRIAELRIAPEAQQAAAFFGLDKTEKARVGGTPEDPREWMRPDAGAPAPGA